MTLPRLIAAAFCLCAGATQAAPDSYTLDPDHTQPRFEILHNGFSYYIGAFLKTKGQAQLDPTAGTGSVNLEVQMDSFSSGNASMDKITKAQILKVDEFPTMVFKSEQMRFVDGKPASVDGNLTLGGVTKPLTLVFTNFNCGRHPVSKKEECGGNLTGNIRRSDFGITLGIPAIADEVKILAEVEAFKDSP